MRSLRYLIFILITCSLHAQPNPLKNSGELYADIEKLGVLANVLYIAAHPDDENTRMISYLSNDLKVNTRYLSLTRGDGGQNLIGTEIKELLGVIRTQELLAARRIDGGSQMFSRANDFGYSKTAEETIEIWDDRQVLSDVVWAMRTFRPDIIINRFDHESSGRTHGHHTASAMLSYEAFDMAGDASAFPDQLKYTPVWQPQRLFWNTSWWFFGGEEEFEKVDKSRFVSADVGTYYPHKGISNNEMAAYSRSMHKCQGMGNTPQRGSHMEYLQLLKGDMPADKSDLFSGIDITWNRLENGKSIMPLWRKVIETYDFRHPEKSIPALLALRKSIDQIKDPYWRELKLQEIDAIIQDAAGLFIETNAEKNLYVAGDNMTINTEIASRLADAVSLDRVELLGLSVDTSLQEQLVVNEKLIFENTAVIPGDTETTAPYWLKAKGSLGMYKVNEQELIGNPETKRAFQAKYHISIQGTPMVITKDVSNKYTDPERGEVYRPVEVTEKFYLAPQDKVIVFDGEHSKELMIKVKGMVAGEVQVNPNLPTGWTSEPSLHTVTIDQAGGEAVVKFTVTPPRKAEKISIKPYVTHEGKPYKNELVKIDYQHIPLQHVALPAGAELVNLDIKTQNEKILYVEGAGDKIPESLRQIGYTVDVIEPEEITTGKLTDYQTVIMGIRAYNKSEALKYKQSILFDYVSEGGNLIVQYNTTWRRKVKEIGPYPLQLSRDRVSVETAPILFLEPEHPVLNTPNKITQDDFKNWVQERGLYFADEWDDKYTAILSSHDPGEDAKNGGLLIAQHGKGHFIYTGYSWFRQLPAGVPGAYRLFANIISL